MKNYIKILFAVLLIVLIASIAIAGFEKTGALSAAADKAKSKSDLFGQVQLFADSVSILRSEYVEEVDSKKLIYGAMRGMLASLDDYSSFMDPEEYDEIRSEAKGEFGGIGVEITMRDGILTIITPMADTPAEAAGISPGDKIVEIDGKVTKDITLSDAMKKLRGKPGSSISLTIWREKDQKILKAQMKRAVIKIKSLKDVTLLDDKTGYIKLVEFQENTPRDLEDALKKLESQGMDALILDLRNNPGGVLDVAVDVAEKFLPKDTTIVSVKGRNADQNAVFKSKGKTTHPDYPIVIITNEGSASAAEIVAGAMQDNKRGILVGAKTFGKASVQAVVPLKDNSAVRFTVAYYLTPSGKLIKDQGIAPDVAVEYNAPEDKMAEGPKDIFEKLDEKGKPDIETKNKEKDRLAAAKDNQFRAAVNIIKAIKISRSKKI